MTDLKESMGNIWAGLGLQGLVAVDTPIETPEPQQNDARLNEIYMELLGSIEALQTRVKSLEDELNTLKQYGDNTPGIGDFTNAFDLMSPKELLGRHAQPVSIPEDEEVRSVKGFVAPVPEEDEEEDEVEEEEVVDDEDEDEIFEHASEILTYIESYGGAVNNQFKRLELIPNDISDSDRKLVYAKLEKLGVKKYSINNFRHFYYKSEEEGSVVYDKFMKNNK